MTPDEVRRAFNALRVWEKDGVRAPNKPLLLLLALAQIERGGSRWVHFRTIEKPLHKLLVDFGPHRIGTKKGTNYPFWYLKNDGFWEIHDSCHFAAI